MGIARGMHLGNHYGYLSRPVGGPVPPIEPGAFWHPSRRLDGAIGGTNLGMKKFYVATEGGRVTGKVCRGNIESRRVP